MLYKLKEVLNKNRCYCETEINQEQLEGMVKKGSILGGAFKKCYFITSL